MSLSKRHESNDRVDFLLNHLYRHSVRLNPKITVKVFDREISRSLRKFRNHLSIERDGAIPVDDLLGLANSSLISLTVETLLALSTQIVTQPTMSVPEGNPNRPSHVSPPA